MYQLHCGFDAQCGLSGYRECALFPGHVVLVTSFEPHHTQSLGFPSFCERMGHWRVCLRTNLPPRMIEGEIVDAAVRA